MLQGHTVGSDTMGTHCLSLTQLNHSAPAQKTKISVSVTARLVQERQAPNGSFA